MIDHPIPGKTVDHTIQHLHRATCSNVHCNTNLNKKCIILKCAFAHFYKVIFDISNLSIQRDDDLLYLPIVDVALDVKGVFVSQFNVTDLKVRHHLLNSLQ